MNKLKKMLQTRTNSFSEKSIKTKIILWYTALTISTSIIFLGILFYIGSFLVRNTVQNRLKKTVHSTFERVDIVNNEINLDSYLDNFTNEIFISIYDKNGEFIYGDAYLDFELEDNISEDSKVKIIKAENSRWYIYEEKREIKNYGYIRVRGITPASRLEKSVELMIYISLVTFPLLVLASFLGGYIIVKKSFEPMEKIIKIAEQISAGNDLSQRINIKNRKDEISTLANAFDKMFDRLQDSFNRETQFTSDVSHELRTPISVIASQTQYGLKYVEMDEENREILESIQEETQKMTQLVSNLLTLARMDKGSQKLNIENTDLSEILEISAEIQRINAKKRNIKIITDNLQEIYAEVDKSMISRIFTNLISNAITYGKENGYVKINLFSRENNAVCEIIDNGIKVVK